MSKDNITACNIFLGRNTQRQYVVVGQFEILGSGIAALSCIALICILVLSCFVVGRRSVNAQTKTLNLRLKLSRYVVVVAKASFVRIPEDVQVLNESMRIDSQALPTRLKRKVILFRDLGYCRDRKRIVRNEEYLVIRKLLVFPVFWRLWNSTERFILSEGKASPQYSSWRSPYILKTADVHKQFSGFYCPFKFRHLRVAYHPSTLAAHQGICTFLSCHSLDKGDDGNSQCQNRNKHACPHIGVIQGGFLDVDIRQDPNRDIFWFCLICFGLAEVFGVFGGNRVCNGYRSGWWFVLLGVALIVLGSNVLLTGRVPWHWGL